MKFPPFARYDRTMKIAHEFLLDEDIIDFPIDPLAIIIKHNWGKITYTELAKKHCVSIAQVIRAYQSEDGAVDYNGTNYTIAYNDTIKSNGRINFTLMHEIGHIQLNHFVDFKKELSLQSSLTPEEYKILENESNSFARNVLSPVTLVSELDLNSKSDLMYHFEISKGAADTRLKLFKLDSINLPIYYIYNQLKQFQDFMYSTTHSNHCNLCGYFFVCETAKYCPVCGDSGLLKRGVRKMKYSGYVLDQNGRALICPRCENEEIDYAGDICKICGINLVNKCAATESYEGYSQSCENTVPGNARHCFKCGNETTYLQSGLLKRWDDKTVKLELVVASHIDDDPF